MVELLDRAYANSIAASTKALLSPISRAGACVVTAGVLVAYPGTGGATGFESELRQETIGYRPRNIDESSAPPRIRTPSDNLVDVLRVFRPSISELANLFGVSRQTIYNWQGGERPSLENEAKLDDLAAAASIFESEGMKGPPQLLRRKTINGKSISDIVNAGGSARDSARQLVATLRKEEAQRRKLEARLAAKKTKADLTMPFGAPMLDENG